MVCGGSGGRGVLWSARLLPAFRLRVDFGCDSHAQGSEGLSDMDTLDVGAMEDQGEDWQTSKGATTESLCQGREGTPVVNTTGGMGVSRGDLPRWRGLHRKAAWV